MIKISNIWHEMTKCLKEVKVESLLQKVNGNYGE